MLSIDLHDTRLCKAPTLNLIGEFLTYLDKYNFHTNRACATSDIDYIPVSVRVLLKMMTDQICDSGYTVDEQYVIYNYPRRIAIIRTIIDSYKDVIDISKPISEIISDLELRLQDYLTL